MVFHVFRFYHGTGFSKCNSVFSLALQFWDNHGMMGFSCFGWARLSDGFEAEWGGSPNDWEHGPIVL